MLIAVLGFTLAPANAYKTTYYKETFTNKNYDAIDIEENTPTKKVTYYAKFGTVDMRQYKTLYKKTKQIQYESWYSSHGKTFDRQLIQKVVIKYKYYDYKKGKTINKFSYKTLIPKHSYVEANYVIYKANKNWIPVKSTVYMKNIKY